MDASIFRSLSRSHSSNRPIFRRWKSESERENILQHLGNRYSATPAAPCGRCRTPDMRHSSPTPHTSRQRQAQGAGDRSSGKASPHAPRDQITFRAPARAALTQGPTSRLGAPRGQNTIRARAPAPAGNIARPGRQRPKPTRPARAGPGRIRPARPSGEGAAGAGPHGLADVDHGAQPPRGAALRQHGGGEAQREAAVPRHGRQAPRQPEGQAGRVVVRRRRPAKLLGEGLPPPPAQPGPQAVRQRPRPRDEARKLRLRPAAAAACPRQRSE